DLDLPAAGDELVPHPERAAHHLQARLHLIAQFEHEPGEPVAVSRDRPSPAISPPGASAHHCAVRYAQSTPTYFTSGLLPDRIRHRRVSPARRPFFMTFHKGSIPAWQSRPRRFTSEP